MLTEERPRAIVANLFTLIAVGSIVCILSGPWIAREVFTSENALNTNYLQAEFDRDPEVFETFDMHKNELEVRKKAEVYEYVLN